MPVEMKKLDASLQCEWELWRSRARADPATPACEIEIVARFTGDAALLEQAGLRLGYTSGNYAIGYADVAALPALQALDAVHSLHRAPKLRPLLDTSVPAIDVPKVWEAPLGIRGRNVIIGIIDDGIDIGHPAFRRPVDSHSRVLRLWDQTGNSGPGDRRAPRRFTLQGIRGGNPIPAFRYGEEWTQDELTTYLQHHPAGYVDDHMPGMEPVTPGGGVAHGSHTAAIAAGNGKGKDGCDSEDKYIGAAPEADLVIVKRGTNDGIIRFIDAVCYIVQFAATAANFPDNKPRAVVISCSLGFGAADTNVELHDALLEPINVLMAASASRVFVAGAGNDGGRSLHATVKLSAGNVTPVDLKFDVAVGDRVDDEFDLSCVGTTNLVVTIRKSGGAPVELTSPTTGEKSVPLPGGHTVRYKKGVARVVSGQDTSALSFFLDPPTNQAIAPGDWILGLLEPTGRQTVVDAWIRQEFGKDPNPKFTGPFVDESNMVCAPARGRNVIAVGAYEVRLEKGALKNVRLSPYSSRGQFGAGVTDPKPDVVAPGTSVISVRSRARKSPKISKCVDFYGADTGTSMAAPHVAGVVALMLERNRTLWFHEIRDILRNTAKDPGVLLALPAGRPPNDGWGYGIVSAEPAVSKVVPSTAPAAGTHAGAMVAGDQRDPPVIAMEQDREAARHPPAAEPEAWSAQIPGFEQRLRGLDPLLQRSVSARLVIALISTHVDEIARLVNANRRVAAIWRHGGPALVRHVIASSFADWPIVPAEVAGFSVRPLLARLLQILQRYGGERLRDDARRYRQLIVAVPDAPLEELDRLAVAGASA